MGETCFQMPARVFGFEYSSDNTTQPQKSPGHLEQRASLLSALLKGSRAPLPSTFMDASDAYSDDEDEDMEDVEAEQAVAEEEEELLMPAAGGSAPVPIPSTSESFLRAQRELLKRFVYVHQIEEMRRQCAAYFARQARLNEAQAFEESSTSSKVVSMASVESAGAKTSGMTIPRQRAPGF